MNVVLSKPVTIKGMNIFGLPSKVTFHPAPDHLLPGLYWKGEGGMTLTKLSDCSLSKHRITLAREGYGRLEAFEHVGFLRWMGFHHLAIESNGWPPFDGGAEHYLQALGSYTRPSSRQDVSFKTVSETVQLRDPNRDGWGIRIEPTTIPRLRLYVSCDYPDLGAFERQFDLGGHSRELLEICETNTIGLPHRLYPWLKRIRSDIVRKSNWLAVLGEEEFKRRILLHRAQDLMGALSLLCSGESLFVGNVYSHCAGHKHDLPAIYKTAPLLTCL